MQTIHLAFCFCGKDGHLQQMFRDLASVVFHNVLFVCCLAFQLSNLLHLSFPLLQFSLQNEAHSWVIFFILCHDC